MEKAGLSGKPSTPWSPDGMQDFMHAKVVVADDVSFVGSFNFSRSGERNAENVLEIHDPATADTLARYVEQVAARYPRATLPEAAVVTTGQEDIARRGESPPMSTQASTTGPLGQPRGIGFAIIISIVTLGIYSLYWVFKTQEEVKEHSGIGVGGVLGLVIYIVLSPVTWFLIPSDVGKMFKADGRPAPFTGWTGLWLLLPIIGMFVWFIKIQGALNRYWESKAGASAVPAVV